mgnify:CR=1 FL=1
MNRVLLVAHREIKSAIASPVFFVIGTMFLILAGFFFFNILILSQGELTIRYVMGNLAVIMLFVSPLITMRTFTEEKRQGTFEMLMTSPLTSGQLVLGKFLGVLAFHLLILAFTLEYWLILERLGEPDRGPIMAWYLGLLLMTMAFSAVGIFASSVAESQMGAAGVGFGILLLLYVLRWVEDMGGSIGKVLFQLSVSAHVEEFEKGVIDSTDLLYFGLFTAVFLFLTARVIESRRWSG